MAEEKKDDIILSIHGMCKSFGRNKVLDHINMDVKRGTIMGLMGENGAGKSTMMKCLFGTYQKDEGTIVLDGKEVNFTGPKDALENGIAMVHQELNQCLERSVVDNLFLGRYPVNSAGVVDETRMKVEAADLFRRLGLTVSLTAPMRTMSVSKRQMCEIAKAISYNSKIIVLDEPTSSLTVPEVEKLFSMMRKLRDEGISLIYISHKMDEIFEICDQVSVLRDGSLVMTKDTKDTDLNELIAAMVGRSLDNRFPPVDNTPGKTIFSVKNLSTKYAPHLQDISFDVREGEIFGLYGLVGAGRTELLEDYAGTLEDKTIGIVNDRLKSEAAVSREKGLLDALEGTGCSILWTLYTDNESADIDMAVSAKKKADLVLALGTEQLEGAGAAEEEREIHGALVYGIAASEKALYYLDHDNVRGLVIPNGFDMGYQSVMQVARKLKHSFFQMRDQEVSFHCVRKGDLFTEDKEGLLFGVAP